MPALNINDLNNGKQDLDHIAEIAMSDKQTAVDRGGKTKLTVRGAIDSLKAFNVRGAFGAGTLYATKDVYTSGDIAYVAVIDHVSSTIAADLAAGKVTVHQGATREELATLDGASLIGYRPAVPGGNLSASNVRAALDELDSEKTSSVALAASSGAGLVGTSIGNTVEQELVKVRNTPRQNSKGASKEEARGLSTGVNWISNMRPTDPASKSGTAGFTNVGSFNGDGSDNFAAWELPFVANSYVCQARLYWSGQNNNCFIGYNTSLVAGAIDNASFFSIGFAATGFVFNDKTAFSVLVPAANLAVGFYSAVMMYANGFFLVSLLADGDTKAQTFVVNKVLGAPRNAQIGCYSAGDSIRDFRFCATPLSTPFAPPFGGHRAMSTPISIPETNPSGVQISVHLPAGYDPRITHRLAVYCHGSGGTDKDLWTYPNENSVLTALLNAGYVVMSANYGATAWGNPASVAQNVAAIQYVAERYNVFSNPYIIGQSMGGMVGFNTVLAGGIKPAAFAGIFPAVNLRYQYDHGFAAAVEGAYGFAGGANFDAATAGYDVVSDNSALNFRGLAVKIWHSYGDTVVPRAQNSDALKTLAEQGGAVVSIVTSTGDHGDPSSFDGAGIVSFFSDY